jgi:hypothetical protein
MAPEWLEIPNQDQRPATKFMAAVKYNKRMTFLHAKSVSTEFRSSSHHFIGISK